MSTQEDQDQAHANSLMTEEERAAMAEDDMDEGTRAALQAIADKAAGVVDEDGGEGEDADPDPAAKPAPAAKANTPAEKPAAAESDDGKPKSDEVDDTPAQRSARYKAELPADYDDKIANLRTRDQELRQKYKDGDIDIDERDDGLAEISSAREELLVARATAATLEQINQQSGQQQWEGAIQSFMAAAAKEEGGFDYRKDKDKAHDLDTFVKALGNNPANENRSMEWFLQEGNRRVRALHGVATAEPKKDAATAIAEALRGRASQAGAAPKTLAQVPGADGPGDVDSEFSDIDRLDGEALEDAIAKMSPARRAKYLAE